MRCEPRGAAWSLSAANEATLAREAVYPQATGLYMHGAAMHRAAIGPGLRVQKDRR